VVIAERRILLAAKRSAVEVIVDRNIPPTIKREVSIVVIDRQVVAATKLGAIAINVEVSCSINCNVPIAICRQFVASTKLGRTATTIDVDVSAAINRDVSLAIDRSIASRAKISITRQVSLMNRAHPGVVIDYLVSISARHCVSPLPGWRSILVRAPHSAGVCRPCRPNIRCPMRRRSIRPGVFGWLTPRRERQREATDAY
jgi:hypothetical protein